jgi:DNA-binding CsgD family transcriptional regulator
LPAGLWGCEQEPGDRIPRRVGAVVRERLDRLSPRCRHILQVAAVLGRTLDPAWIAELVDETTVTVQAMLGEAVAAGILTIRDREISFQSVLVLRVVRQTIPAAVRSALAGGPAEQSGPAEGAGTHSIRSTGRPVRGPVGSSTCEPGGRATPRSGSHRSSRWDSLSDTELAIARLVSAGLTNQQIATRVSLSPHTVNYYLRRIFRKLDVASRVEVAALASAHRAAS